MNDTAPATTLFSHSHAAARLGCTTYELGRALEALARQGHPINRGKVGRARVLLEGDLPVIAAQLRVMGTGKPDTTEGQP